MKYLESAPVGSIVEPLITVARQGFRRLFRAPLLPKNSESGFQNGPFSVHFGLKMAQCRLGGGVVTGWFLHQERFID